MAHEITIECSERMNNILFLSILSMLELLTHVDFLFQDNKKLMFAK